LTHEGVSALHYLVGRKFEDKEMLREVINKIVAAGKEEKRKN
jgi:hypothetical protein